METTTSSPVYGASRCFAFAVAEAWLKPNNENLVNGVQKVVLVLPYPPSTAGRIPLRGKPGEPGWRDDGAASPPAVNGGPNTAARQAR